MEVKILAKDCLCSQHLYSAKMHDSKTRKNDKILDTHNKNYIRKLLQK